MIAVIGAGISGIAAAMALRAVGVAVEVFEQAPAFGRIGAAITLSSNAVKVLDGLGIGEQVRDTAHRPSHRISRQWDTNEETSRVELGRTAVERYGTPQLTIHRADLLSALEARLPPEIVRFDARLVGLSQSGGKVEMAFADGANHIVDGVIGADGIHSAVREALFGPDAPVFAGMSGYRSLTPVARLGQYDLSSLIKWWGPTPRSQIVTVPINRGRDLYVFATTPETHWQHESWSFEGDIEVLRNEFKAFHQEPRDILDACDTTLRSALYERNPLDRWSQGNVTLIGDACHAMMPFMAQGGAMGLEDAAILSRCVAAEADWPGALAQYERTRMERASKIQLGSHRNEWLREPGNPDWVYGYDAWTADLA